MRKILLIAAAVVALAACKDNDGVVNKGKLDPNAMVSLRPAAGVPLTRANPAHLTAKEIVEQAGGIAYYNLSRTENHISRGFSDGQRDLDHCRLLMFGTDIIDQDGNLETVFIEGEDIVVLKDYGLGVFDTIAYVPNTVLRKAETRIKEAFADENFTEVYRTFDEAFTFLPITGAEWRALKAEGKN